MGAIIGWIHQGFSTVMPFIILLGFLIFVHELGHFLVAKWCGVRVEVFSLGFGKRIFQYKRGDTNYCIALIPLGGYVKMFGDEMNSQIDPVDRPFSFTHKKLWQRIAIVIAGPLMNFLFAIVIFAMVSLIGEEVRRPIVGDIADDSIAYKDGFRAGDEVLSIDSEPTKTWENFQDQMNKHTNEKIQVAVHRDGSSQPVVVEATPALRLNDNILSLHEYIGDIEGMTYLSKAAVIGVMPNSLAEKFGLKTGDRIQSVNGKTVTYFRELENLFVLLQKQNVDIQVARPDDKSEKTVKLSGILPSFSSLAAMGVESPDLYLSKIVEESPAANAGLMAGDRIIAINNMVPQKWDDILNTVKNYGGQGTIDLTVLRDGQEKKFQIAPKMTSYMTQKGTEEKRYTVGIMPWIQSAPPATMTIPAENVGTAVMHGIKRTSEVTTMVVVSFLRLIQNKISPKNISGVISIGQAASETFKIGISHFLQLMGLISVNLFVLNLLPIPVLDGGHLLFYCIEGLKGTPLSMRKMEIAQQIGLVVLMSLMALSLFNDFSRVLGFW